MQMKMLLIQRLLIFYGFISFIEGARECPEMTKAHLTRCDMFYKCMVMPSDNIVWVAKICPNGLIYDTNYKNCVMPGDDWECQLDNEGRSSSADDENVYGVNNLSYLKEQIKGFDTDDHELDSNEGVVLDNDENDDNNKENILITMSNNGTMTFSSNLNSNSNSILNSSDNEIESSGDGVNLDDYDMEDKSSFIPIPTPDKASDKLVSIQLERLSQLLKTTNQNENEASDISPDQINNLFAQQKLKVKKFHSNKNAVPVPHNKLIEDHHLQQILDLQKKLNNLASNRYTYSTPSPPIKYTISNGYYPADATTVHIKATNELKNPEFPNVGSASSQIVVNRPGGSVVFRLPYSNSPSKLTDDKKPDDQISAETLKMILELSKHMSNQAPNTPQFVHSLPPPTNNYVQPITPIVQPILYNLPWEQFTSLSAYMNALKTDKMPTEQHESMEKISSVSGIIPAGSNTPSESDDIGPTTIIHNHIPITVSQPNPTNSIVNRIQNPPTTSSPPPPITLTTTMSSILSDRYDSYGIKRPDETIDLNNYYPFPPFPENIQQKPNIPNLSPIPNTVTTYSSPYSTQQTTFNGNLDQPKYIKISQSRPDNIVSQYSNNNAITHNVMGPIPTFVSVNGGYTNKVLSTFPPQSQLNDGSNVNEFTSVNRIPYSTIRPTNFVQIATASIPTPNYAEPPKSFTSVKQRPHIYDKIDRFDSFNEPSENHDNYESSEKFENDYNNNNSNNNNNYDNEEYADTNVEQNHNEHSNENVMNLLANYNSQIKATSKTTPMTIDNNFKETESTQSYERVHSNHGKHQKHKQIINLNGNFLSLETYQQSIEPFLVKNPKNDLQIQVLTCATGVRQANQTDCTRYFVCNEKTGKVLSYKCPPYTAFNANIKLCNGETYVKCFSDGMSNEIDEKIFQQKIQQEIIDTPNRIQSEVHKTQHLAQLLKLGTDKILKSTPHTRYNQHGMGSVGKSTPSVISPTRSSQKRPHRKSPISIRTTTVSPSTPPPKQQQQTQPIQHTESTNKKFRGKRKIPCKQEGKLPDNQSIHHYFLCFKDQTKTMRARRMQCPSKLQFCSNTLLCTAVERCINKFG